MKKKILAVIMCVVMVMTVLPVYAFAEDTTSEWTYNVLRDGTAEITGYNGNDTDLIFPEEIDGYTMVAIADKAFEYDHTLDCPFTSITIPDTYKRIGNNNFNTGFYLEEVNLPHTLEYIGLNFLSKTKLCNYMMLDLESQKLPKVFYVGEYLICADQNGEMPDCYMVKQGTRLIAAGAFFHCTELKNIIIPEGVEYVNEGAFIWCDSIKSVVFPNTVKRIEYGSFIASEYLSAVVIPSSVEYIDERAFLYPYDLTVYGVAGTLAETLANGNDRIHFVELNGVVFGDIDGDGTVTINDYASTASCAIGNTEFDGNQEVIGDMNNDCIIDAFDAAAIDRIVIE